MSIQGKLKLTTARRLARLKLTYFTTLFESMTPVEVPGLGTFGVTEHLVMVYDPKTLDEWDVKKVGFVIAHEAMHIFHKHAERGIRLGIPKHGPLAKLYNLCGDAYINRVLREVWGWCPDDAVLPERMWKYLDEHGNKATYALPDEMHNVTTEEAYFYLRKLMDNDELPGQGQGKGSGGEGAEGDGDGDEDDEQGGGGQGPPDDHRGHCGSGAGHSLEKEIDAAHPASRPATAVAQIVQQVAQEIEAAARKNVGSMPAGLLRDAKKLLEPPKVPWNKTLQRKARNSAQRKVGAVDFGYHGLSRRQGALTVALGAQAPILPKLYAPELQVDIAIDTSGSMSQHELGICAREAKGIFRSLGAKVTFTAIDAQVHEQKEVHRIEDLLQLLKGGGGTDFRPYFDQLMKRPKNKRPHITVFMTDGCGPAPVHPPPGIDVIWLLVGNSMTPMRGDNHEPITWGTMIEVKL